MFFSMSIMLTSILYFFNPCLTSCPQRHFWLPQLYALLTLNLHVVLNVNYMLTSILYFFIHWLATCPQRHFWWPLMYTFLTHDLQFVLQVNYADLNGNIFNPWPTRCPHGPLCWSKFCTFFNPWHFWWPASLVFLSMIGLKYYEKNMFVKWATLIARLFFILKTV